MNEIYSKIENGNILESREVGRPYRNRKALVVNGYNKTTPNTAQHFLDAGWKLRVAPIVLDTQKQTSIIIESAQEYTFKIIDKTAEELQAELIGHLEEMDFQARNYIDKKVHWTAGPMIFDKAKANKPKSTAIKAWTEALWLEYYTRVAMIEGGMPWSDSMLDFSSVGALPYKIKEAMQE